MPQLFRIGPYLIYFWSNEGEPLESVHVHIAEGQPHKNATKQHIIVNWQYIHLLKRTPRLQRSDGVFCS